MTPAPPSSSAPRTTLGSAETLASGERLVSPSREYSLEMQAGDGNLVLSKGRTPLWSTGPAGAGSRAEMQRDGNLVVYNGFAPRWSSSTAGFDGATLALQDDGNLVIYHEGRGVWAWSPGYLGNTLGQNQQLLPGALLRSADGRHRMVMQEDGNLVLYRENTAVWVRSGGAGSRAVMQGDGNLVIYDGSTAKWDSNGTGFDGAALVLQDDGNAVVYHNGHAIWTSVAGYTGDLLHSGATLGPGAYLKSPNKQLTLLMQAGDGNLALYDPSGSLWGFGTNGNPGARAVMQTDGNFVVYQGNTALRDTQTGGRPGAFLRVQDDANVVVYQGSTPLWSRNGGPTFGGFDFPLGSGNSATEYSISQNYCEDGIDAGPHLGVDWPAAAGTPVRAAANGSVLRALTSTTYGNMVMLRHDLPNGEVWYTLYAHMRDAPSVVNGQAVSRRQQIGVVGNTGNSQGNHLHFAVTNSSGTPPGYGRPCPGAGGTTDPVSFINARRG